MRMQLLLKCSHAAAQIVQQAEHGKQRREVGALAGHAEIPPRRKTAES
ncbi:MAG: hypothetical protein LKE59_08195 [Eubacterium sp.]|nr:hypothetical protein [Eubacterium sp.]MCH4080468.1 hypothetical protein [Eubacterium sp.]